MATAEDILIRTSDILSKDIKASSSALATFTEDSAFRWIKDAYNECHRILHLPIKKVQFQVTNADLTLSSVASDIYNGCDGIRQLTYLDKICVRQWRDPFLNKWGDKWKNPPGCLPADFWMEYDDHGKIKIIPWSGSSGATDFEMVYVYEVAAPASTSTAIPAEFVPFVHVFPSYLIGRFLQRNRDQRAAAFIAEFQGRLADVNRRSKRQGRRNAGEAYSAKLTDYYIKAFNARPYRR